MPETDFRTAPPADLGRLHAERLSWLEKAEDAVIALPGDYPDGYRVPDHSHSRAQLLHARTGIVKINSSQGRWMVPPEHAMWIPAGVAHSVEMLGVVRMLSVYVRPDAVSGLPEGLRVVGLTGLVTNLIVEAMDLPDEAPATGRAALVKALLLLEIANLPQRPLGLPFPADPRLAGLCRRFVEKPSPHATIEDWARRTGMSRRTFTRTFLRETGLSLSTWRQQACLFAALPRLAEGEPITSVALDLGYESVPAFTTMFRRMLGKAPRDYFKGTKD
ncbi:AraC family transcriptional regulator [Mesorhizobium sp. 1B3]|uniref:AraC family transcriptional regulator n=1 Tax=Mesorhizobium sp. 1B3 TaxID=3243599 RepID=UPI003D969ED4